MIAILVFQSWCFWKSFKKCSFWSLVTKTKIWKFTF